MSDTRIKGVDISSWQSGIPFDKIKAAGVDFALIRAGLGKIKDKQLDTFVKGCEKYGIKYGFYWYSYALTIERAKEESEACLECIKQYSPDYPIYFDIEDKSQIGGLTTRTRTDMAIAFCEKIRAAGYTAGVYANPSWFNNYLYKSELINDYEVWLAHWTEDPSTPSRYNFNQKVWQWGLDYIAGFNVDGDISFFDYSNGAPDTPTAPKDKIPLLIEQGDTVYFDGGSHYGRSIDTTPVGRTRKAGLARVTVIAPATAPHKYHLIGVEGGSDVYGWVDADLVHPLEEIDPSALALGDKVKVKQGAKNYKGGGLASFVYKNVYTIMQINAGVAPDYIVIGVNGDVTDALHAADLIKQ